MKMSQARLTSEEVVRYRTVSQLASANLARVAELCERQVQESMAQTSRNTRAILGSIQPLNPPKPKGPQLSHLRHPRIQRELAKLLRLGSRVLPLA